MAERDSHGLETLAPLFFRTSISICVVAACLVAYRLYSMFDRRGWFGVEDGMVATSFVFLVTITAIGCEACHYGFGYHSKDIAKAGGNRATALMYFWLFQIFYKLVICFNKLAFLTLYLRLFPQRTVRNVCYATIAIVITGTTSFVLSTVLECLPVSKNWNKSTPGSCINNTAFRWSWAGFNTVTDLWVVLLPIPIILKLQMSLLKRVGTSLIFALGLFIVAISALRMQALNESVTKTDTTWDSAPAFVWSHVEAAVGLIATCLPALKKPVSKILPKKITGTAGSSSARAQAYRLRTFSGKAAADLSGGSAGYRDRNSVYITTQKKGGSGSEDRESQERILDHREPPGIFVTKDVSVQSAKAGDAMAASRV